jgi:hypothetical protein
MVLTYVYFLPLQVEELKAYLRQLGLSDEGGRYVLRDRLMTMLVVRRAATAGDMDHLLQQLSQVRCVCRAGLLVEQSSSFFG